MDRLKNLLGAFILAFIFLSFFALPDFPLEGGALFLLMSALWFLLQARKSSVISLSKGFSFAFLFGVLVLLAQSFSYHVPASWFMVFTSMLFLSYAVSLYVALDENKQPRLLENSLLFVFFLLLPLSALDAISFYSRLASTIPHLEMLQEKISITFRLSGLFFAHPNIYAGFLNFVWPIVLIRMVKAVKKSEKFLWGVTLLLIGTVFLYTNSRGGIVGSFFGGAYLLYRFFQGINAQSTTAEKAGNFRLKLHAPSVGVGIALFVLLVVGIIYRAIQLGQFSPYALRASRFLTLLDSISSGRGLLWNYAWEAFLERPLLGHGNVGFAIAYAGVAQLPPGFLALSAHNLWLNVAVEYGLVGLILLLISLTVLLRKIFEYTKVAQGKSLAFPDAYLAGCLAFLAHHFFDVLLGVPTYLATSTVILVLLLKYALPIGEWKISPRQYLLLGVLLFSTLGYSYWSTAKLISPLRYHDSPESLIANFFTVPKECQLAEQYPENALYSFECSMEFVQQFWAQSPPRNMEKAQLALGFQQRGVNLNPYWAPQRANLAVLLWLNEQQEPALEYMRETAKSVPKNSLLWLNLGWMEERVGNFEQAQEAYQRALRLSPLFLRSYFAHTSTLFSLSSYDLEKWMNSEEEWDTWYEYEIVDKDFLKGIIGLGLGHTNLALKSFQSSAEKFEPLYPSYYAYLAYATYLADQPQIAYPIAHDLALLDQRKLYKIEDALLNSIIGQILYEHAQYDLAYKMFMNSYTLQTRTSEPLYYSHLYRQPLRRSDLSPLLIRNCFLLQETKTGWEWFIEQVFLRESLTDAEEIARWYQNSQGIALLGRD